MTSQAAIHKRNVESSILFMQQEHADTLKGLHSEIHKLQKKCTDLTFQLTMHGLNIEESEDTNNKFSEVKKELEEQTLLLRKKESELTNKDVKIKELESVVKAYKKKYLDESRKQSEVINRLKADVETKSCNVAYLTSKLHQVKMQTQLDSDSNGIVRTEGGRVPAPPQEMLTKPRRIANIRRNPSLSSTESVSLHSVRKSSGRSSGSNGSNSPDISPFLPHTKSEQYEQLKVRTKPTILPPIATSHDNTSVVVHQVVNPKRIHRHKPTTPETLALEQLPHRTKNWVNPQESHSSEYK